MAFAGEPIARFPDGDPNISGLSPFCWLESRVTPKHPDKLDPDTWTFHVTYVPAGMTPTSSSIFDIIEAGGFDVNTQFHPSAYVLPTHDDPAEPAGGYAVVRVGQTNGVVQQVSPKRVQVAWPATDSLGQPIDIRLVGSLTSSQMVASAADVQLVSQAPANAVTFPA
ncbi:MAG: hypothetical protein ACYDH6_08470 [Acidimicrobiales bacterium]